MANEFKCSFCQNPGDNLLLFKEDTLKKCQKILQLRKYHNLKYKDVVLPTVLYEMGFHRQCYKSFTGLMKKYYSCESTGNEVLLNITDNQSTKSSTSFIPELTKTPEEKIIPGVESGPSTFKETCEQLENDDIILKVDVPVENEKSIDSLSSVCIYCDQKTKKHKLKKLPLHSTGKETFLFNVIKENENYDELRNKVASYPNQNIFYHHVCQKNFQNKIMSSTKSVVKTIWHELREYHRITFDEIIAFIRENVIEKGRCYTLTYLHKHYLDIFERSGRNKPINFTAQHLQYKLLKEFRNDIKFFTIQHKKILAPKYITAVDDQSLQRIKNEDIIQKAALILRRSIVRSENKKLPKNISAKDLKKEASIPQDLLDFYFTLIAGSCQKRKKTPKCIRQVRSYCEDIVYEIQNGNFV